MGLSLASLRTELRKSLGVDAVDLPNATQTSPTEKVGADELLNRSLWEVTEKFAFREKERSVSFTIDNVLGHKYTLPGVFDALLDVSIESIDGNLVYTPLNRMTRVVYDSLYSANSQDQTKYTIPTDYVRENDCIIFYPSPNQSYNVKLRFLQTIADLSDSNTSLTIPQSWHEIILLGAVWRGFITFGDMDRADRIKQHQLSLITSSVPVEAKEEFDSHLSGVEVIGRSMNSRCL